MFGVADPRDLLGEALDPAAFTRVVHATTLFTNALIERKGARIGIPRAFFFDRVTPPGQKTALLPQVTIAAQPTRGLDVGAIEFVHRRLVSERGSGRGILLVSLEFEEVRSLADRILAIYEGEIVGEFPPDVSEEELGIAMTGGRGGGQAAA